MRPSAAFAPVIVSLAFVAIAGCGSGRGAEPDATDGRIRPIAVGLAGSVDGPSVRAEVARVAAAGAGWVREDLEWARVQPRPGTFRWQFFDEVIVAAARRSVRVLPILDGSPCWAVAAGTPADQCWRWLPERGADFADFAAAAVNRYGPDGDFWSENPEIDRRFAPRWFEVWNEPYHHGSTEPVDAARFAALQRAAVTAGRRADPRTRWLLAGALTADVPGGESSWPEALKRADPDLLSMADALSIHIYPSDDGSTSVAGSAASVRDAFAGAFGQRRPVWVTELGFAACGPEAVGEGRCVQGSSRQARERRKATLLRRGMLDLAAEPSVSAVFVYGLHEYDRPFYGDAGLLDPRGRRLPAWRAFRDGARLIESAPK